jgi:hypothetical protein
LSLSIALPKGARTLSTGKTRREKGKGDSVVREKKGE